MTRPPDKVLARLAANWEVYQDAEATSQNTLYEVTCDCLRDAFGDEDARSTLGAKLTGAPTLASTSEREAPNSRSTEPVRCPRLSLIHISEPTRPY